MKKTLLLFALIPFAGIAVHAQTNDPRLSQQYYIGAHNIEQLWNITTGSSGTRIAIYSATGFTSSHEDMTGSRYLNPFTNWFAPDKGFASELAGIVGANSNNAIGIAGINWNATLKSYNFVEVDFSNPDPNLVFNADNVDYYFNTEFMSHMLDQANTDNMDVHLFTFGVPTSSQRILRDFDATDPSLHLYRLLYEGPSFPTPPEEQYQKDFQNALISMGTNIWNALKSNNFIPPIPNEVFRHKLWDAAENQNRILVAPVGDAVDGRNSAPILMPFSFNDFVIGVGGGEFEQGFRSHWDGAGTSPYVNVTAAAKDIVSLSGEDYDAYNEEFNSTQASAAIVAGVASLLKTQLPDYTYEDIRHVLQNTAIDIEDPGFDEKTGHGWLDAQAAINYIQNNDFVRKSVPKSEFKNIQMHEDAQYSYEIERKIAFERFSGTGCASDSQLMSSNTLGKKKMLEGRIDFDYQFAQVPDVWLRNSSTGTDVNPIPFGAGFKQFYEPFEKSLRITSIDDSGFDFELDYWGLKVTNTSGQTICTDDLPIIDESHPEYSGVFIDYTAVGDETDISTDPPSAPTNLVVTNLGQTGGMKSAPQLNWDDNPESNLSHYQVYRKIIDVDHASQHIASPTSSSYTDWEIHQVETGGNDITYFVRAVNNNDQISGNSNLVMVHGENINQSREDGNDVITEQIELMERLPKVFALNQNYPNPFNPATTFRYQLPEAATVTLAVYNTLDRRVATLVDGGQPAGFHTVYWDGSGFSSGLYFLRMQARGQSGELFQYTRSLTLVK